MMHRLLIGYCILLFTSCICPQEPTKTIEVIYCPENNKETSFYIPKDITGVFKSQNIGGVNYEIISDSKIQIITSDFYSPKKVALFQSFSQMIFGSPNQIKTNELITSELHTIKFEKNKSRKPYPPEPSENQIFIFYNAKNINQTIGRKYYVNSSDQISKVISKHRNDKKNFYIFNSPPHVVKTPKPAPPTVPKTKLRFEKNSIPIPIVLQAIKSPGCILKWSSKTGSAVSPKISTHKVGTFKYYVSQKNLSNKLESKQIEIIVTIFENAKPPIKKSPGDLTFLRPTLSINNSNDGKLLTWRNPNPTKENQTIRFALTFYDSDNNNAVIHQETFTNIYTYDVSILRNKFRNGERPRNGIDVTIIATRDGFKSIRETRHLSLNNSMKIYNCY
jgi:hypothetical protein